MSDQPFCSGFQVGGQDYFFLPAFVGNCNYSVVEKDYGIKALFFCFVFFFSIIVENVLIKAQPEFLYLKNI